jgi:hypothetical protein
MGRLNKMKKIIELKKVKEGKYQVFKGQDKYDFWHLIILDYNYGDPQLLIKKGINDWIELPNGLSGSFTSRKDGGAFNNNSFTLDKFYSNKLLGYDKETECNLYQDGDKLLLSLGSYNFSFMEKISTKISTWQIDVENIEYEECPDIRKIESTYTLGDNKIVMDNLVYKPTYSSYRFFFNEEEWEITKFDRYRDGGTTEISVKDLKGNIHEFYTPTPFNKELKAYIILNGVKMFITSIDQEVSLT